jgi:hypothetical protein
MKLSALPMHGSLRKMTDRVLYQVAMISKLPIAPGESRRLWNKLQIVIRLYLISHNALASLHQSNCHSLNNFIHASYPLLTLLKRYHRHSFVQFQERLELAWAVERKEELR